MTSTSKISIFLIFPALAGPPDLNAPLKYLKEPGDQLFSSYNYNQLELDEITHDKHFSHETDFHENEFSEVSGAKSKINHSNHGFCR